MRRCPTCDGWWPTEAEQAIRRDANEATRRIEAARDRAITAANNKFFAAADAIKREMVAAMKAAETGAELPGQADLFTLDEATA